LYGAQYLLFIVVSLYNFNRFSVRRSGINISPSWKHILLRQNDGSYGTELEQVIQVVRRNAGEVSAGKNDSKANNGGRTQVARGVFIYFVVVALQRNSSLLTVQIPRATFYPQFNCLNQRSTREIMHFVQNKSILDKEKLKIFKDTFLIILIVSKKAKSLFLY